MPADRLSALDASFLALETPTAPLHVGWNMRFGGSAPPVAQLRRHLEARLHLVPRFRQRIVRPALGLGAAYWEDAAGFTLDAHVHAVRAPAPGGPGELREITGVLLSAPLPPEVPLWRLHLVDGLADGGFALVGNAHHALVDGIAAIEVALLLFGPAPEDGRPQPWQPARPRRGGLAITAPSPQGTLAGGAQLALELARTLRGARPVALRDAAEALDALSQRGPVTSLQANRTRRREVATLQTDFAGARTAGRRHGATVNDVLLAASTLALSSALHRRGETPSTLKVLIPVNVRGNGSLGALGNRISLVTIALPTAERDPVAVLRAVRDGTRALKTSNAANPLDVLSRAADRLPAPAQRQVARAISGATDYAAVISNIPGPPVALELLGRPLQGMYPSVPVPAGHGLTLGCISYDGRLHLGLTADAEVVPDLEEIAQDLESAFEVLRTQAPTAPTPWRARARVRRSGAQRAASRYTAPASDTT